MIPLAVPNLAGNEARYLQECVESTFVSSVGPFVTRFEKMVADAAAAREAVAVTSGTAGLHLALVALGVGRDDLVIIPSLTFVATANAVRHAGAHPWLFDVSPESWTLDPAQLDSVLEEETTRRGDVLVHRASGARVAAILPVHTLGQPADMDPIREVATNYGLPIVADAAAALGATYRGRAIGALGAELSVFSFNGNKTVTSGGGGAVAGDDESLVAFARHLSTTARRTRDYDHDHVGFNHRMTNLQAAVGCAQMELLDHFVAAKRRIRSFYDDAFRPLQDATSMPSPEWSHSACWFSGFVLAGERAGERNGQLREQLKVKGVDCRPFWKPMHFQEPYADALRTGMEVTDDLWERVVTLPCSTGITDDELETVASAVLESMA